MEDIQKKLQKIKILRSEFIYHFDGSNVPADNCIFKVNNRNTRTRIEICPKLKYFTPCSSVSIVNFEEVNAGLERTHSY